MNSNRKLYTNYIAVLLLMLSGVLFVSCFGPNDEELEAGQSLGIASIPNLRDMGGYKTSVGDYVARELLYRSNQLNSISDSDMVLLANLNLVNDFDLRTSSEREAKPDELPDSVNNVWLDVLADDTTSGPANLINLLRDPQKANTQLGDGKVEDMFKAAYRQFISLPSAQTAFRELFLALGDENQLPALFHCTTGKDRTGWAAAALLTIIGVSEDAVIEDYLRSNEYILPMYQSYIDQFVSAGGYASIPAAIFGVKEEYLNAAFDEMETQYGSIESYFSDGLGISAEQQASLRDIFLEDN